MAKNKPAILVVTGGYFPGKNFGGIATSRYNFSEALGDEFDIVIVTRDHDYKSQERYKDIEKEWNQFGKARVLYCSDGDFTTKTFRNLIELVNPILMYASGTITSYFSHNRYAFRAAREKKVPILLTPDGDVCRNAMRTKRLKKFLALILCRLVGAFRGVWFQPTAEEEVGNLPRYLGVPQKRIILLPNLPYIFPARGEYHKNPSVLKIVFLGRIHPIKNLKFLIRVVCKMKSEVKVDIYGPLESETYWGECQELIVNAPNNVTIEYKGRLEAEKAKHIAKQYDCCFLPTLSENYGYTIEEALCCGCPVLISRGTTPWDDLHGVAGFAGSLNDEDSFVYELEKIASMGDLEYKDYCSGIAKYLENKLSYDKLCMKYKELIYKVAQTRNKL